MAEKILKCGVEREPGYLYFLDRDGNLARAKMARGKKGKAETEVVLKCNIRKEKGCMYFLDKDGDISKAVMGRRG